MSTPGTELALIPEGTTNLVLAFSGEVFDLADIDGIADALDRLADLKRTLEAVRAHVTLCAVEISQREGTRTLHGDGRDVVLSADQERRYDALAIRDGLLNAGMPEDRVDEIVVASYRVNQTKAKAAAGANEQYRTVIDEHTELVPKTVYASVK